ncbi:WecB/TagA/CpsF family glycosyltransferase [Azomonas macrocytogenes]|uniref:Beta-1,4-glucosyltransferase n=1 Tax=Azomonas macrocytogenes TaxID=69962 RepID=A0A839T8Y4_AZOMA|nr:WecB/TagA/CpsF family glycosyltransferase [Azomonas macrocytogenes]MBB3104103.1 beta-1,4-glucosyltransferase [Azomonas macrocytogenes]
MNLGKIVPIAGFPVHETTRQDLAIHLLTTLHQHEKISLLFANSNFVVKCKSLLNRMYNDSVLIVNDGVGLDIVAKCLHGGAFKANLNGTDFTPYLFCESSRPLRVFMLGAKPEVVEKAAEHVEQRLGQTIVGYCDGYSGLDDPQMIARINQSGAELLLVALGNPLQEEWILNHRDSLDVGIVTGVGALFDFWAGNQPRAPQFIQKIRLEWLFRLCHEPRRLMRRYTVDMLVFFARCFKYRKNPDTNETSDNPLQADY